jgi:hypothetical protein
MRKGTKRAQRRCVGLERQRSNVLFFFVFTSSPSSSSEGSEDVDSLFHRFASEAGSSTIAVKDLDSWITHSKNGCVETGFVLNKGNSRRVQSDDDIHFRQIIEFRCANYYIEGNRCLWMFRLISDEFLAGQAPSEYDIGEDITLKCNHNHDLPTDGAVKAQKKGEIADNVKEFTTALIRAGCTVGMISRVLAFLGIQRTWTMEQLVNFRKRTLHELRDASLPSVLEELTALKEAGRYEG